MGCGAHGHSWVSPPTSQDLAKKLWLQWPSASLPGMAWLATRFRDHWLRDSTLTRDQLLFWTRRRGAAVSQLPLNSLRAFPQHLLPDLYEWAQGGNARSSLHAGWGAREKRAAPPAWPLGSRLAGGLRSAGSPSPASTALEFSWRQGAALTCEPGLGTGCAEGTCTVKKTKLFSQCELSADLIPKEMQVYRIWVMDIYGRSQ